MFRRKIEDIRAEIVSGRSDDELTEQDVERYIAAININRGKPTFKQFLVSLIIAGVFISLIIWLTLN